MSGIVIDDSRWPLVVMHMPPVMTLGDLDHHFEIRTPRLFARGRFAAVIDTRAADIFAFTALHRRRVVQHRKRMEDTYKRLLIAEAYVLESVVARGIVTAVQWLAPPCWPQGLFGDVDAATAWARRKLPPQVTASRSISSSL